MSIHNQEWECDCGWSGHDDDLRSECTFAGNQEEPPEYEAYCPQCGNNWDQMIEAEEPETEGFGISIADAIVNNHQESEAAMLRIFGPDYQEHKS